MSTDQIIAIIGHSGTWIIAICVLLQLREMAKQRRSAYKPEIVIARKLVYGLLRSRFGLIMPIDWRDKNNNKVDYKANIPLFLFSVYNIGLALAINIKLQWDFEISDLVDKFNDFINNNGLPLKLSLVNDWLSVAADDLSAMINYKNRSCSYDYVLPSNIDINGITIDLPESFKIMTALDFYKKVYNDDTESLKNGSPYIKLTVEYEDIVRK